MGRGGERCLAASSRLSEAPQDHFLEARLLIRQRLAVLASRLDGEPQASAVDREAELAQEQLPETP
jgi:hypothetical protein